MGKQISPEAALAAFRQRHGELADENVLLKALISELEDENARLRGEAAAGGPSPTDSHAEARVPGEMA